MIKTWFFVLSALLAASGCKTKQEEAAAAAAPKNSGDSFPIGMVAIQCWLGDDAEFDRVLKGEDPNIDGGTLITEYVGDFVYITTPAGQLYKGTETIDEAQNLIIVKWGSQAELKIARSNATITKAKLGTKDYLCMLNGVNH